MRFGKAAFENSDAFSNKMEKNKKKKARKEDSKEMRNIKRERGIYIEMKKCCNRIAILRFELNIQTV